MRDSFVFYRSYAEAMKELDTDQKSALLDAICMYALDCIEPEINGVVRALFALIKPQIDSNNVRYENGKKGGAPRGNQNAAKQPKTTKNNLKQPNVNANVNDNANVKIDNVGRVISTAPSELQETLRQFSEMRRKIKAPMTERAMEMLLNKVEKLSGGDSEKARAIIEQSILHSWKGVYPLKEDSKNRPRNEVAALLEQGAV